MQSLPSFFSSLEPENQINFFQDLLTEYVQDFPLPYLEKYPIQHYQDLLDSQAFIQTLCVLITEHNLGTGKQIQKIVSKTSLKGLDADTQNEVALILYENLPQLKKHTVKKMIAGGEWILLDFNWNLNLSMASDDVFKTTIPHVLVQFILKRIGSVTEERVEIEFGKVELEEFLVKLKNLQTTILETNLEEEDV